MKLLSALFICLLLSACASAPPHIMKNTFDEADLVKYSYDGKATIEGQIFLKTQGGEVRYGAGERIRIIPATAYTKEVAQYLDTAGMEMDVYVGTIYADDNRAAKDDPLAKYIRKCTADGSGHFSGSGLTAGDYFIDGEVYWMAGNHKTGAHIRKLINVKDGEHVQIMLTQ